MLFSSCMYNVSSLPFLFFVCLKSLLRLPSLVGQAYVKQLYRKFKFELLLKQEKVYMSSLSMYLIRLTMGKISKDVELIVILIYRKISCSRERIKSVIQALVKISSLLPLISCFDRTFFRKFYQSFDLYILSQFGSNGYSLKNQLQYSIMVLHFISQVCSLLII